MKDEKDRVSLFILPPSSFFIAISVATGQFLKIAKSGSRRKWWRSGGESSLREGGRRQSSQTRVLPLPTNWRRIFPEGRVAVRPKAARPIR